MASQPPRKSYFALNTPIQKFWYQLPIGIKYASAMVTGGYAVAHMHPDTLITAGPPVVLSSWYLYGRWRKYIAGKNRAKVTNYCATITIPKYDESLLDQVLAGVESEFDYFVGEVVKMADTKIKEYLFQEAASQQLQLRFLLDENQQLSVHLGKNLDLFVIGEDGNFIKLAIPMYSSLLLELRKRVGTVEVYMVREESTEISDVYRCRMEVTPFKLFVLKADRIAIEMADEDV